MTNEAYKDRLKNAPDLIGALFVLAGVLLSLWLSGCESNNAADGIHEKGEVLLLEKSKPSIDKFTRNNKLFTHISYQFDGKNTLTITQRNAAFNCCCQQQNAQISLHDTLILIAQKEDYISTEECDCLDLYDVVYKVSGVSEKAYRLVVNEIYAGGSEEKIDLEINLKSGNTANFMFARGHYPWGM